MKIILEVDTDVDDVDDIGEALRQKFWDRRLGFGCYENFDWADGVTPEPDEEERYQVHWDGHTYDEVITWRRARRDGVLCRYYWDGDGTLEFTLPDGRVLENTDCKKTYYWQWRS